MSGLSIEQMPLPDNQFRIDVQSADFESCFLAATEDQKRSKQARKMAKNRTGKRAVKYRELADILDPSFTPQTPITLASSRYMRDLRIKVIGAVLALAVSHPDLDICRFDIAKPRWAVPPRIFRKQSPVNMKGKLRADLLRSARKLGFNNVPEIQGYLIAFLHGEFTQFDNLPQCFHPHFHALACGDWIAVVDNMRRQPGYAPTDSTKTPIRATRELHNLPYALSYLLKSYWPAKWKGSVSFVGRKRRTTKHRRIPEPHHSDLLLWLNKYEPSDLILKMGVYQTKKGFSMKNF